MSTTSNPRHEPTVPYAQVPVDLLTDGRLASCPPLSRLLYHEMFLRAALTPWRDRIPLQPGLPYASQVKFLVGEDTERLDKLIAAGAVVLENNFLRITLTLAALNEEARRAREDARSRETSDAPSYEPEGPDEAVAPRQKPSASKTAMRYRHDMAAFAKRAKGWSRIPAGLSWAQWLRTPEGENWTVTRERAYAGYSAWVTRVTREGDTQGVTRGDARVTPGGDTPSETYVSSENSEKKERERRKGDAGDTPRVTPQGDAAKGVTPTNPLDVLREAAGANASLVGALERDLTEQLRRRRLPDVTLRAMGAACKDVATWWRGSKRPNLVTLTDLAGFYGANGYEWKALDWLLAYAATPASAPAADDAARERVRRKTEEWARGHEEQKRKRAAYLAAQEQQENATHE